MAENLMIVGRRSALVEADAVRTPRLPAEMLAIRLLPPRARLCLRLAPSLPPSDIEVAGFALQMPINRYITREGRTAMRLGPDEWQLRGPQEEAARIAAEVESALAGQHYSLVDIGHARVGLALSGARAAALINAGCPLDLSRAAFPTGAATRTLVGKCEVILARTDDQPTLEVECSRSFAAYLHEFLTEAARELRAES